MKKDKMYLILQTLFFVLTIAALIITHVINQYVFIAYFMLGFTFLFQSYNYTKIGKEGHSQNYMILGFIAIIYAIYKLVV